MLLLHYQCKWGCVLQERSQLTCAAFTHIGQNRLRIVYMQSCCPISPTWSTKNDTPPVVYFLAIPEDRYTPTSMTGSLINLKRMAPTSFDMPVKTARVSTGDEKLRSVDLTAEIIDLDEEVGDVIEVDDDKLDCGNDTELVKVGKVGGVVDIGDKVDLDASVHSSVASGLISRKEAAFASNRAPNPRGPVLEKHTIKSTVSLAKKYSPSQSVSGWLLSEKLDGMRAILVGQRLYSREGNVIHAPRFFLAGLPGDITLDGELFLGRGRFQDVMSVCRRKHGRVDEEKWRKVKYVVFDAPEAQGGIAQRLAHAKSALDAHNRQAEVLEHVICEGPDHVISELKAVEAMGGEGVMLRHPHNTFRPGRTSDLLKVKTFKDDEAVVIAHDEGMGKYVGILGALVCRAKNGKIFKVGTGFTDVERATPPGVGTVITYRYFELTRDEIPRHPVFDRVRPDVEAWL